MLHKKLKPFPKDFLFTGSKVDMARQICLSSRRS